MMCDDPWLSTYEPSFEDLYYYNNYNLESLSNVPLHYYEDVYDEFTCDVGCYAEIPN